MSRFKKHARREPKDEGLLMFGYSSRVYPNDARSELMAGESHLQPWALDETVLIDRFDVRLLLSLPPSESRTRPVLSGEEEKEERECEEERWRSLHDAELASLKRMEHDHYHPAPPPKKAEFGFTFESSHPPAAASPSSSSSRLADEGASDSEDEPFVPPAGIKLPMGLETPDNQKLNHVIERTALFVVKQGPQMEIVIKAKQRTNQEQFGFLHFDHLLNPYYKYIMKLIREGKYTPDLERKKTKKELNGDANGKTLEKKASSNALTALMDQHGGSESGSDSDSDCELHPSLLAGSRRGGSPDPVERGGSFAGPQKRPKTPPPEVMRNDYKIETANDSYSALFKNLAQINVQRDKEKEEVEREGRIERGEEKRETIEERPVDRDEESEESKNEWDDFTQWFISFYGMSPPIPFCNLPYIPPPPDMEKTLAGYARYVGENGAEAEFALKGRVELQLHFLAPSNPHHLYYLSAVRRAQWEASQRDNEEMMKNAVVPPPPPLNRKQRRMAFMDAPQVSTAPLPSIIDPAALFLAAAAAAHSYESPMTKSASSPLLLSSGVSSPLPMSPAPPAPPIPPLFSSSSDGLSSGGGGLTLLPCPVPPNIALATPAKTNEIMSERQIKARLFMEKILNDKRKRKEDEEGKGVEDGEIVEEREGKEGRRERREGREGREKKGGGGGEDRERRKEKEKGTEEKKTVSASFFDNLIKEKMDALLKETVPGSLAVEKKNEEIKESKRSVDAKEERKREERREREREKEKKEERREKEREERKRKREKKEKRRHRSSSRSSSDEERRRRRRRSRSKSSDLPSQYRRR